MSRNKNLSPISVVVMDYDLNVSMIYESLSKLSKDVGEGHAFNQNTLRLLHAGYVCSFYGKLILLQKFYNPELDFMYTTMARKLCNKVENIEQKKAQMRLRKNYNRRIAILNDDFTIKESVMCSMKDLAQRLGMPESTVKSHLFRAPERIFKIAINERKHKSDALVIHMNKYNNLIKRIENYRVAT